jgi:hypothetical protein
MGRRRPLTLAAAVTVAIFGSLTGVAAAAPLEHGKFHDEFSDDIPVFCGRPGLTVRSDGVVDGKLLVNSRGRYNLVYFQEHVHLSFRFTNLSNGRFITTRERSVNKDLKVVDNGDGTLTITVLATGNFVTYGADGRPIARNPGQVRFQLLIDHNGTPTDPSDDVELADLGIIKGSTGRSDDFCAAAVAALT